MTKENRNTDKEPLRTVVNRAKARWLKRMMYGSLASSTEKCFGYAVSDHLNCVTLDAWPAPRLVASRLGFKHERTVHRAAQGLQEHGLLQANRVKGIWRFSPVFIPADGVTDVAEQGHSCPKTMDKNVNESFLSILLIPNP